MLWRDDEADRPVDYTLTWADSTGGYGESYTHYEPTRTATNTTDCTTTQRCWHLLPCGICQMTYRPCPYGGYDKWEITC